MRVLTDRWTDNVEVSHENDPCFENRLVMGYADCKHYAGLVETPERCVKRKPGPLSDTLQAGACFFPQILSMSL